MIHTVQPRSHHRWRVAAQAIGVVVAALTILTIWLTHRAGGMGPSEQTVAEQIMLLLAFYAFLVVGLVLIARRPSNALGWVLAGIGTLTAVGGFAEAYARFGLVGGQQRAAGAWFAAWIAEWWWYPTITLVLVFVPLLFPTGRPVSPRWRWLLWTSIAVTTVTTLIAWVPPVLVGDSYTIANPFAVPALGDVEEGAVGTALGLAMSFCALGAAVSLIVRFRRSRDVERQQLKWFVYAGSLAIALPVLEGVGLSRYIPNSNYGFAIVIGLIPISIGIAVTRYRLYEIDRLISRTVTYAILTAVLLGLYLAAVTTLTTISAPITRNSPVAVAAATLLAAAAFGPARRRIQRVVDRRFNRASYDAAETLEDFRARLRGELDLESISTNMQAAMNRTVEPNRSLVWLRQEGTS